MINKLWSRIPERPPLQEGQRECDICRARFLDPNNFIRHRGNCRKKTVEEVEENEKEFYHMIEKNQKEKETLNNNDQSVDMENDESEEIIKPTQAKKQRRSRSKKRNWTVSKKRRRKISSSSEPTCKVYVKQKVDVNDLSKSGDKMENVEFYKNMYLINTKLLKNLHLKMRRLHMNPRQTIPLYQLKVVMHQILTSRLATTLRLELKDQVREAYPQLTFQFHGTSYIPTTN